MNVSIKIQFGYDKNRKHLLQNGCFCAKIRALQKKITHIDSLLVLQQEAAGGEGVNRIDACAAEKI